MGAEGGEPVDEAGHILLADDEETFLYATAELLRRAGYACTCAADAATVAQLLSAADYDLLIADIKMPGNTELEMIRELPRVAEGLPVVVVTGYPSLRSAIESIHLPVMAYLVKPFEFDELLAVVQRCVERSRTYRAMHSTLQRVQDWSLDLKALAPVVRTPVGDRPFAGVNTFLTLTLRNIVGCLADVKRLTEALGVGSVAPEACQLLNCPRSAVLTGALRETIELLERTKSASNPKAWGICGRSSKPCSGLKLREAPPPQLPLPVVA